MSTKKPLQVDYKGFFKQNKLQYYLGIPDPPNGAQLA